MTGAEARERAAGLREAGSALRARSVADRLAALAAATGRWGDPGDPARRAGEAALAARLGVGGPPVARILDAAFRRWDRDALEGWVAGELGDPAALDGFVAHGGARRRAVAPGLVVHLAARGVPTTPVADLLAALAVGSAVWLKPATAADDLAARFAATLGEVDPGLGAAVEVAGWERASEAEAAVLDAADLVVATGGGRAMETLREKVPAWTRLVLHGPRLSAAAIARESIEGDCEAVLGALADDTAFAGQAGCLSPVVAWVEGVDVDGLAEPLLAALSGRWPGPVRRETSARERARWAEWTALAGVEAAAGAAGALAGGAGDAWTVAARKEPAAPDPPPVPRAITLAPVARLEDVAGLCARRRGLVATVGVAAPPGRLETLADALVTAGVERVAPLGRMQRPPLDWRRDGRPTLADLVRWVDLEERA